MYKSSKLTELYVTVMEESEKHVLSNNELLAEAVHQDTLLKTVLDGIEPIYQDLILDYIESSKKIKRRQLNVAAEEGYKTGLIDADKALKADRKSYLPTSGLLKIFEHLKNEKYYSADETTMEVISMIEDWIFRGSISIS